MKGKVLINNNKWEEKKSSATVCFVHGYVAALVFMFPLYNGQWEGDCPEVKGRPLV